MTSVSRKRRASREDASAPTRLHFFGGKGGVGKTTCAAAYALGLARRGQRVLIASTDPAHSLQDALGRTLGPRPRSVAPRLRAVQPHAPRAFAAWMRSQRQSLRLLVERGTYLDADDVDGFLDLTLPGIDELFGLVELLRLLESEPCDALVVDTAPTGHTLRLFGAPDTLGQLARLFAAMQEKHHVIAQGLRGFRQTDAADGLIAWVEARAVALKQLLRHPERTSVHWIALPETLALEEAADGMRALGAAGIRVNELIVNRMTPAPDQACGACSAKVRAERQALATWRDEADGIPLRPLPSLEREPVGVRALSALSSRLHGPAERIVLPRRNTKERRRSARAAAFPFDLPDSIEVLFLGGKGGVGKTTAATAAALALAERFSQRPVLLLSVDPAHSLEDALGHRIGDRPVQVPGTATNLRVRELDASQAFARERRRLETAIDEIFDRLRGGSRFDAAYDRAILQELTAFDPPGTDEVFGVLEVMEALRVERASGEGARPLLVIDTAPTGHALRLLELPKVAHAWVKGLLKLLLKYRGAIGLGALAEDLLRLSRQLTALQTTWTDPARTAFIAVTRPGRLPLAETRRLTRALHELRIRPTGMLVNALTDGTCLRCRRLMRAEGRALGELRRIAGRRAAIITAPSSAPPPRGPAAIAAWSHRWKAR